MKCTSEFSQCAPQVAVQLFWTNDKESKLKFSLQIRATDEVIVAYCKGRIVYRDEALAFAAKVGELLDQTRHLVLDLSGVKTIDGAGLGELATLQARAQASGCAMKIAAPSESVRELLEITKLAVAFEIYSTVDEAVLSARGQVA
jgi:anti-anti-sigma factor